VIGMALGPAMLEQGWTLVAQPGSAFLAKGAERINTWSLIEELAEGKVSAEEWAKMCEESGIADLSLALPTESAEAGV
jgi:hypothetical protein